MTTRFCHFCGLGPLAVSVKDKKQFLCSDCHAEYSLGKIIQMPTITLEEAETLFTKKELTDQQKYGTTRRKWKVKKKSKKKN